MKYKYILIDIDGTLINFDESFKAAARKILELDRTPATPENINSYYRINDDAWFGLDLENVSNPYITQNYHSLYRRYINNAAINSKKIMKLNSTPEELAHWYEIQWAACSVPNKNALEICNLLSKNFTLCIATNGLTAIQLKKLTLFNDFLSCYFVSEDIGYIKPERQYFEHILNSLGAKPEECLMVGDSIHNDIAGANNALIDSCYYNPTGKNNNSGIIPTYEIGDFNELLKITN